MQAMRPDTPRISPQLQHIQQMLGLETHFPCKPLNARYHNVVFVCIDCEAFESATRLVSEIGIAVLDTTKLSRHFEDDPQHWLDQIKGEHYRLVEHGHLINHRYVHGCPNDFNFGHTTWVRLADIGTVLTRILRAPNSLAQAADFSRVGDEQDPRNVVLVGHGMKGDLAILRRLGVSINDSDVKVVETLDTQTASRPSKKSSPGLSRLLHSLDISPSNLHNAGNDAVYTLQALVSMAIQDFKSPGIVIQRLLNATKGKPTPVYIPRSTSHIWAGTSNESVDSEAVASAMAAGSTVPIVTPSTSKRQLDADDTRAAETDGRLCKKARFAE